MVWEEVLLSLGNLFRVRVVFLFPCTCVLAVSVRFFVRFSNRMRPLSASISGGCMDCCFCSVSGRRFCMLSVRFHFWCSLPSLLCFRLSASFLASSSATFDICFQVSISFCLLSLSVRHWVTSFWMVSSVSCSVLIRLA